VTANEPYRAAQFIDAVEDPVVAVQLDLDLISNALSDAPTPIVLQRLDLAEQRVDQLEDPEIRALMYSRLARLQTRVGRTANAARNFGLALEGARIARVESRDLMFATIAVDHAYALDLAGARAAAALIGEQVLKDRTSEVLQAISDAQASSGLTDPAYALQEDEP